MTVHHISRHVIPDMEAVHWQVQAPLDELKTLMSTLRLCHHVDQDLLLAAEHSLAATKRSLLLSLREKT